MHNYLKEILRDWFGPLYEPIRDFVYAPAWGLITAFWEPGNGFFWLYMVSSVVIGLIVYLLQCRKYERLSLSGFLQFLLPKAVFTHKSAIIDYKFYVVNAFVYNLVTGGAIFGAAYVIASNLNSLLQSLIGSAGPQWEVSTASRIVYTVLAIMAHDLGVTLGHYLEHKIPFFWEFHKVHHSAEVLTPFTNYRNHPVDKILEMLCASFFVGMLTGTFRYLYPGGVAQFTIINISVMFFVYYLIANLRHSHIWLSYGWRLDHIISSPAMHQLHHSSEKRHFDKNYALVFSFWDYLAGTLYVPKGKEEFNWGLSSQEHLAYNSVWNLYAVPIKKVAALIRRKKVAALILRQTDE
ncbi:MAG: sterol desaturase family protein [Acidobacteria bacterium]|nr:sterol desaturase family protein [Acidobacteriota bacterium]